MDRLERLEARVRELEDKYLSLISCVKFDPEQPYTAKLLQLDLAGARRTVVNLVISAILTRARGEAPRKPHSLMQELHPSLAAVFDSGPITRDEAIGYVARAIGVAPHVAEAVLVAHRDAGLGAGGHQALGT